MGRVTWAVTGPDAALGGEFVDSRDLEQKGDPVLVTFRMAPLRAIELPGFIYFKSDFGLEGNFLNL